MGRIVVRPAGYTGYLQQLTWQQGNNIPVTAHLWGGAGGAGGNDDNVPGGSGSGGGYSQVQFTINEGDVLRVAVGGPGTGGAAGGSAAGGGPGSSYLSDTSLLFSTLLPASPPVFRQFNSVYCTFLNTYGVWTNPTSATTFDRTYTVNFPVNGYYMFTASAYNTADVYLDNVLLFAAATGPSYPTNISPYIGYTNGIFANGYELTAGSRQVRIVGTSYGSQSAVALTIAGGSSNFGGSYGGTSGGFGVSGAGGGGGGATVVLLNGTALGAAGGGGGGGGGGNNSTGQSAPGDRGQTTVGSYGGQSGTIKWGGYDGGGGGGGGGGWAGGNGGQVVPGYSDAGGYAGVYGLGSGNSINPSGRTPGGAGSQYYPSGIAVGGSPGAARAASGQPGTVGYAVFEFDVPGTIVNTSAGGWDPAIETYIKVNGNWLRAETPYVKQGGIWFPVNGYAPVFENIEGQFGSSPRAPETDPQPPAAIVEYHRADGEYGGWYPDGFGWGKNYGQFNGGSEMSQAEKNAEPGDRFA
jgi:hypothetical protein